MPRTTVVRPTQKRQVPPLRRMIREANHSASVGMTVNCFQLNVALLRPKTEVAITMRLLACELPFTQIARNDLRSESFRGDSDMRTGWHG